MQSLTRILKRGINFVNRFPQPPSTNFTRLSLFNSHLSASLTSTDLDHINEMQTSEALAFINDNESFLRVYDEIAPIAIAAYFGTKNFNFVYKANYLKELQVLEIFIIDTDGFFRHYVPIRDFVPITYSDTQLMQVFRMPFMDFVDVDMVYKKAYGDAMYFFLKDGEWNAETANLQELDFRNLYEEIKWLDAQIERTS